MAKNDVERVTDEKIAKGGVLVKLYFDVQDKDKEKLQPTLAHLVTEGLMKEPGVVYAYGSIEEPIQKEDVYLTSGMITLLVDSLKPLLGIAFKYAPAAIEVLRPEKELHLKQADIQNILMDVSELSINYSRFILEKVLKPEDVAAIKSQMENRAELGKKFLEQRKKEGEQKK